LGKEMAILSSDEEEINPQIIGEQLKKNYNANSVSEYEINSKSNSLFSGIEGETEEDFFRAKLFVAAKENHLRSSDFKGVPKKKAEYYTITNKNPNTIYKLYEIYGERNQNRDLLSRVFLCKKGNENVEYAFPEEFFEKANLQSEGFTRVEVENKEWVEKAEEEINLAFKEIFIERLKEADPHKVSQKVSSVKGIQVQLIQTLQGLKKKKDLFVEENFFEFAKTIREDAEIVFKEMMQILGTTQLSSDKANKLKDTLNKYNINIKQVPKVAFNDFASALFTFYNEVILEDSSMRGSLYKSSEIHSQLVLSIYI
ncbi:MAG: hypothetical protein KDK45_16550, partial [Leptospiraceae bacterium]|nr:hypothetical protein [Leptospiraceae bacterium]